jgi:hypothetical protein
MKNFKSHPYIWLFLGFILFIVFYCLYPNSIIAMIGYIILCSVIFNYIDNKSYFTRFVAIFIGIILYSIRFDFDPFFILVMSLVLLLINRNIRL